MGEAVELVDEQDRGRVLQGIVEVPPHRLEQVAEVSVGLPLGRRREDEFHAAGPCKRSGIRSLPASGRTRQQHSPIDVLSLVLSCFPVGENGGQFVAPTSWRHQSREGRRASVRERRSARCIHEAAHHRGWWEVESIRNCRIHCVGAGDLCRSAIASSGVQPHRKERKGDYLTNHASMFVVIDQQRLFRPRFLAGISGLFLEGTRGDAT